MHTPKTNTSGFRRDISPVGWEVPDATCDTHMHIVGPFTDFPLRETRNLAPPEATAGDYDRLKRSLGIGRCVVVQPSFYAADNACTMDAVRQWGDDARAVVVVPPGTEVSKLRDLHERGARGIRSQMIVAGGLRLDEVAPVAPAMRELGWHLQLYMDDSALPDLSPALRDLGLPIVFDHMAQTTERDRHESPGFAELRRLLDEGIAWVKLSSAHFRPSIERARLLADSNPDRILWGTDWPHVSYAGAPPDDGALLSEVADWFPSADLRLKLLADNPEKLYFST